MKIGILGAGISGLSAAKLLSDDFEVEVLERNNIHGGIARTRNIDGLAYHVVGGHCFNSKFGDVLNFVFDRVLDRKEWHQVQRDAVINLKGQEVSYPIEYAVKEINSFDPELAMNITNDFFAAIDDHNYSHLEDWFRKKFGDTLAELYFIPYNKKIWNRRPSEMSPAWVEGKLPIPNKMSFFNGLISDEKDKMPHASFFYPNSNDQNTFIDALASGLNIVLSYDITKIDFDKVKNKWIVNDEKEYDLIVSTLPLNLLPKMIVDVPLPITDAALRLRYNKVTTMLWETQPTTRTWTYIPGADNQFHRYIHIGKFFNPSKNVSITEVVGEISYEDMVENGKKDPFLIKPLSYNVSDHAYVVFDEHYKAATHEIRQYLDQIGLYTLGRFGEWQYYNMDVCIKQSIELAKQIGAKYITS